MLTCGRSLPGDDGLRALLYPLNLGRSTGSIRTYPALGGSQDTGAIGVMAYYAVLVLASGRIGVAYLHLQTYSQFCTVYSGNLSASGKIGYNSLGKTKQWAIAEVLGRTGELYLAGECALFAGNHGDVGSGTRTLGIDAVREFEVRDSQGTLILLRGDMEADIEEAGLVGGNPFVYIAAGRGYLLVADLLGHRGSCLLLAIHYLKAFLLVQVAYHEGHGEVVGLALLQFHDRRNQPVIGVFVLAGFVEHVLAVASPCVAVLIGVDGGKEAHAIFTEEAVFVRQSHTEVFAGEHVVRGHRTTALHAVGGHEHVVVVVHRGDGLVGKRGSGEV